MDLTITPDLIAELYARYERSGRPEETAIVLTEDGWEVRVDTEDHPYPVAITAAGLLDYLGGEEFEGDLADEVSAALCEPDPSRASYNVRDERGGLQPPSDNDHVVVVGGNVAELDHGDEYYGSWAGAWWFDHRAARALVTSSPRELDEGETESLWITATGRYVACVESRVGGTYTWWYELDDTQVSERVFDTPEDRDGDMDNPPTLVVAARLARDLVDTIAPRPASGDRAADIDQAMAVVQVGGVLSELLRSRALSALRQHRGRAAHRLVSLLGTQEDAAEQVGLKQSTLSGLINSYDPQQEV